MSGLLNFMGTIETGTYYNNGYTCPLVFGGLLNTTHLSHSCQQSEAEIRPYGMSLYSHLGILLTVNFL
jgi:hypothetical protein